MDGKIIKGDTIQLKTRLKWGQSVRFVRTPIGPEKSTNATINITMLDKL